MIIPYWINNHPAANPCDFSDSMKQKDFFSFSISNIQFVYEKHRKETQPNERCRGTGKRGNVVRQEANPYCSSAKKVPWPAAFRGGWRVSYLVKKLSVPIYCFLALHQNGVLSVLRCIPALTSHTDLRLLAVHLFWHCHCIQWPTPVFVTCTLDSHKRQSSPVQ